MTGGTARTSAADQSRIDVVGALSLICVDKSKRTRSLSSASLQLRPHHPGTVATSLSKMVGQPCRALQRPTARSRRIVPRRLVCELTDANERRITFDRPFSVAALDGLQAPGTYVVEIDEELIEGLSFLAYRRVATTIYLPLQHGGGRCSGRQGRA